MEAHNEPKGESDFKAVWSEATEMNDIKFGTDGWRGVIAEDYTFENVRRVAGAIAAYVLKNEDPTRGLSLDMTRVMGRAVLPRPPRKCWPLRELPSSSQMITRPRRRFPM